MALTTDMAQVDTRPGAKASARNVRMSASKVRVVLNLVRGKRVEEALAILEFSERLAAESVRKCIESAVANAAHNEEIPAEELYVSVAFADEGPTMKRFRPRARGRAGRIHKQTCHITVVVSRLSDDEQHELRTREQSKAETRSSKPNAKTSKPGGDRAARVAKSQAAAAASDTDDDSADTGQEADPGDETGASAGEEE